jgi:hypothetical protein
MVAPTCFGITLPSSGSVLSAFWEMLNWGAVDRILWMGVLCLVTWYMAISVMRCKISSKISRQAALRGEINSGVKGLIKAKEWINMKCWRKTLPYVIILQFVTTTLLEERCAYNSVNNKHSNNYPNAPSTTATGLHIAVRRFCWRVEKVGLVSIHNQLYRR